MEIGTQSPITDQEKQIEQVIKEVERLRERNEELNTFVSRLSDLIATAHQACETGCQPDEKSFTHGYGGNFRAT